MVVADVGIALYRDDGLFPYHQRILATKLIGGVIFNIIYGIARDVFIKSHDPYGNRNR
jgi:hypothetical protein